MAGSCCYDEPFEALDLAICSRSFTRASLELGNHPQLKALKFDNRQPDYVRDLLVDLLEQKDKLRRSDLAIYLGDTLLTSADQLAEIDRASDRMDES